MKSIGNVNGGGRLGDWVWARNENQKREVNGLQSLAQPNVEKDGK